MFFPLQVVLQLLWHVPLHPPVHKDLQDPLQRSELTADTLEHVPEHPVPQCVEQLEEHDELQPVVPPEISGTSISQDVKPAGKIVKAATLNAVPAAFLKNERRDKVSFFVLFSI